VGGTLQYTSAPGKGTQIHISLPYQNELQNPSSS
jgi:signal transduction histidine kinase